MLLIKASVHASPIAGVGLFADEDIPKGTRMWRFDAEVDEIFTEEEAKALPEPKRSAVLNLTHSYLSKDTSCYVLCGDDAKYVNHSFEPNMAPVPGERGVEPEDAAVRDIRKGEEITFDYRHFDEELSFEPRQEPRVSVWGV